ncbi:MAG: glycosyltransferase, partial [bacterium]
MMGTGYRAHIIQEMLFNYRVRLDSRDKESVSSDIRNACMEKIIKKHRALFIEHAIHVLVGKERLISSELQYQRELLQAQEWYKERDRDHEKQIRELKEWSLQQLENYKTALAEREAEIARQIASHDAEVRQLNEYIRLREHELRSVYASKVWKLGCAFRDAKHSLGAALMLPVRIADFACPNSIKRWLKKLFFIEPHEVIKKNFHKFPYRLADRLIPDKLKRAMPYQLRNMTRDLFRTTDERLYKQMKWNGPLVTVVIPCYNYGSYLDEALQSVRNQTFMNHEIIIVDDGSTEALTLNKLKEIEEWKIPGVRVIHQANAGVSLARNHGITESRGKYICCLDADDILEPTYLEKCLLVLESNDLDLCYTYVQLFGDDYRVWKTSTFDVRSILQGNCVSTSAVFKKSCWERAGGYKDNMHHGWEDWDFWISLAGIGARGAVIPEPLFRYRRHGETRDVKAGEEHSELLLKQIRKNHSALFSNRITHQRELRYKTINPLINILRHGGMGATCREEEGMLFLLPWMVKGGADSILLGLAEFLTTHGKKQIHIITTVEPPPSMGDSMCDFLKVTPYVYKLPGLLDEAFWYDYIEDYIRSRDIRTVFICGASYIYPHLPKIKKAFPHIKIIDQIFNDSEMGHIRNNRAYVDYIDLTFVVSEKIRSSILAKYGDDPAKLKTIYHGIDMDRFDPSLVSEIEARRRLRLPEDKRIILFVGRLSQE